MDCSSNSITIININESDLREVYRKMDVNNLNLEDPEFSEAAVHFVEDQITDMFRHICLKYQILDLKLKSSAMMTLILKYYSKKFGIAPEELISEFKDTCNYLKDDPAIKAFRKDFENDVKTMKKTIEMKNANFSGREDVEADMLKYVDELLGEFEKK